MNTQPVCIADLLRSRTPMPLVAQSLYPLTARLRRELA